MHTMHIQRNKPSTVYPPVFLFLFHLYLSVSLLSLLCSLPSPCFFLLRPSSSFLFFVFFLLHPAFPSSYFFFHLLLPSSLSSPFSSSSPFVHFILFLFFFLLPSSFSFYLFSLLSLLPSS